MAFNLATLFVSIKGDDGPLQKQIGGVRTSLRAVAGTIGTLNPFAGWERVAGGVTKGVGTLQVAMGNLLSGAISRGTMAVEGFFSSAITGSMELQDTMQATQAIFGGAAGTIFGWADEMADKFGAVKTETIQAASSFGQIFKQAGNAPEEAAKIGATLADLGMNLASFKGGAATNKDAFEAIQGSLQGNFQGNLDRYNIFLTMAEVNQRAVNMGLAQNTREVGDNAKKMATLALIMEKSKDQQGDLARTADQSHNTWARLTGTLTNLGQSLGTVLTPALDAVLKVGANAAHGLSTMFEANRASFASFAEGVASWVDTIGVAWRNLPDLWDIVQIKFREMFANMVAALVTLPENLKIVGEWFGSNWVNMIRDGANAVMTIFTNLGENIHKIGEAIKVWMSGGGWHVDMKPLMEGFEATTGKLPDMVKPAFVSLQGEIDAVTGKMADREAARAQGIANRAAAATEPARAAALAAADKEKAFKSESLDSDAFYAKLRDAALSGKDDKDKEQLAAQKKTAENTGRIADQLSRGLPAKLA